MVLTWHRLLIRGIAIPPRPPRRLSHLICIVSWPSSQRQSCWSGSVLACCISLSCCLILSSPRFLRLFLPKPFPARIIRRRKTARRAAGFQVCPREGHDRLPQWVLRHLSQTVYGVR